MLMLEGIGELVACSVILVYSVVVFLMWLEVFVGVWMCGYCFGCEWRGGEGEE